MCIRDSSNVDYTNYYATVPSGNLEHLLWLESDRLATLPDAITQASLDNQRMVVANEIRQRYLDRAFGRTGDLVAAHLYPVGHPYHREGGSQAEQGLADAKLDEVREFFRRYYTPNNLSLVIAGDFDPATAKRLVARCV